MKSKISYPIKAPLIFLFVFNVLVAKINAQDQLFLIGHLEVVLIKVIEIKKNEVAFKYWPIEENPEIRIEPKSSIHKIIFESGSIFIFNDVLLPKQVLQYEQRRTAIKIKPLAILNSAISLSVEHLIRPRLSFEGSICYLGLGDYESRNLYFNSIISVKGGFIKAGVKLIDTPKKSKKVNRYMHVLKGAYFKPELVYLNHTNIYSDGFGFQSTAVEVNYSGAGLFLNFGRQWVFNDNFLIDIYLGPGLGYKNVNKIPSIMTTNIKVDLDVFDSGGFGFIELSETPGVAIPCFQSGFKIGFLIGKKSNK